MSMLEEVLEPPKITSPPILDTQTSSSWLGRRDGSGVNCRTLTFTISNIGNPVQGTKFPPSCDNEYVQHTPFGTFEAIFNIPEQSSTVTKSFTVLESHSYAPFGPLNAPISQYVTQDWEVGIGPPVQTEIPTQTIASTQRIPSTTATPGVILSVDTSPGERTSDQGSTSLVSTASAVIGSPSMPSTSSATSTTTQESNTDSSSPDSKQITTEVSQAVQRITTVMSGPSETITSTMLTTMRSTVTRETSPSASVSGATHSGASESRRTSSGIIAGAVIGSFLFLGILAVLLIRYARKRRENRGPTNVKFLMYAPSKESLTRYSSERRSSGETSGITVTYSKVVFDDPQLERVRELRRAYDYLRSNP